MLSGRILGSDFGGGLWDFGGQAHFVHQQISTPVTHHPCFLPGLAAGDNLAGSIIWSICIGRREPKDGGAVAECRMADCIALVIP